jgi:hypothetical protein
VVASTLKSYDLYIHRQGRWLLDSSYSDRHDAIGQARRLEDTGTCEGIRVIEEIFDDEQNATTERTVHWSSNLSGAAATAEDRRNRRLDAEVYREHLDKRVRDRLVARYHEERDAIRRRATPLRMALIASSIFVVWIAGAIALRYLFERL